MLFSRPYEAEKAALSPCHLFSECPSSWMCGCNIFPVVVCCAWVLVCYLLLYLQYLHSNRVSLMGRRALGFLFRSLCAGFVSRPWLPCCNDPILPDTDPVQQLQLSARDVSLFSWQILLYHYSVHIQVRMYCVWIPILDWSIWMSNLYVLIFDIFSM